jgi:hypothetical protein
MEMQDFKEPILADLRNLQHEKAQLEKVRTKSMYNVLRMIIPISTYDLSCLCFNPIQALQQNQGTCTCIVHA